MAFRSVHEGNAQARPVAAPSARGAGRPVVGGQVDFDDTAAWVDLDPKHCQTVKEDGKQCRGFATKTGLCAGHQQKAN